MNSHKLLIILLSLVFSSGINSQNVNFTKEEFRGSDANLKKALKEINRGDKYFSDNNPNYYLALEHYLIADSINNMNSFLNYKIGVCYLKTTVEKYKSISYLEKSYKLNPNVTNDILYYLGQAYHLNYEFDKAISRLEDYKRSIKASAFDKIIDKKTEECRTAKLMVSRPVDVVIIDAGNIINTKFPEYNPLINSYETMMIFTSRRNNTTGGNKDENDNKFYEDIYVTKFDQDKNEWKSPVNIEPPINTNLHDATVGLSADGNSLLIYKSSRGGDIFESHIDTTGRFSKPERLPDPINSPAHESVASFSPDGKTLYFCSNREENSFGKHDILMSKLDSKGKWGPAINLGSTVNTPYDEKSVFMMGDGKTLYFSSDGHTTMGGYDIFRTVFENGRWTEPVNIGYPINTPDDEANFSISADGQHGYFASARKGGYGDLDIYIVSFLSADKPLKYSLDDITATGFEVPKINTQTQLKDNKGYVFDINTKKPLSVKIIITDKDTGKEIETLITNPENGEFETTLPTNKDYIISIICPGCNPYTETIHKGNSINKIIFLNNK